MMMAVNVAPAFAGGPGGVPAAGNAPTTAPAKPKVHTFPITARTADIAYSGPVYQRTATGEVVAYTPPPTPLSDTTSAPAASAPTATSPTTGGSTAMAGSPAATVVPVAAGPEVKPQLLVPGSTARYVDGIAAAPMSAPLAVQEIIWAGNELIGLPYIFGGGHASFISPGYDCSGTVSFALHGASLLLTPEDSSEFMVWGSHGAGRWVTLFSNPEHAYMTVAGLRLDTSSANDPSNLQGPRWRPLRPANEGFTIRHPLGL
jgi:cell wall-associated NlpC family hydrolase